MGRIYAATYTGTITNAGGNTDLLSLQPADDLPCALRGIVLGQTTEEGDAAAESARVTVGNFPATFTVGSGGSAITALRPPADPSGAVWSATARANDTTVATTSGTIGVFGELGWNIQMTPFDFWWPDERFCLKVLQAAAIVVRLEDTPADDFTGTFTFFFEEG